MLHESLCFRLSNSRAPKLELTGLELNLGLM